MALTKLNDNLNIHQSLPDKPIESGASLKVKWDNPVNLIKTYINDVLTSALDTILNLKANTTAVDLSLNNKVDKETGKGLYPDTDKTKLLGIVEGATKNEFAVITSTCTVNPSGDISNPVGSVTQINNIAFPSGYTKDNCVVTAIGRKRDSWGGSYGYGAGVFDASSTVTGCLPTSIIFSTDGTIGIRFANIGGSTLTILYKIVLMKIA